MTYTTISRAQAFARVAKLTGIELCPTFLSMHPSESAETGAWQVIACGGYPNGRTAWAIYDAKGRVVDRFNVQ